MRKIVVVFVCLFSFLCIDVEARTYVNSKYGYAIDIPDYFVERDTMGMFDFRADGGDDYGGESLMYHKDGIAITINSKSCEYESVDETYMQEKVRGYIAAAQRVGLTPSKFFYYDVPPGHKAIGSCRVDDINGFIHVYMGIEVVMHGRTVIVSVEGTPNNSVEVGKIMETFRCVKH